MGLLFIKVFVMRDAYAPLCRAEDCRCVTMGVHDVGCVHCEAGQSQGIQKPYFLAGPEEPPAGQPTGWEGGGQLGSALLRGR